MRIGTYSIVARDPETGELGVAVQSHWFSVGSVVTWAQPGVGAVATQALAEISHGPRALELMAAGASAPAALAELLASDPGAQLRQVALVDAAGATATHTGADCIPAAGHAVGDQVSCQANIMVSDGVWPAMLEAYTGSTGPLAHRLLAALEAGEAAGGDARGRQSAAMLVVPAAGHVWEKVLELRVEDDPDPLAELRRLLGVRDAYAYAERAEAMEADGDHAGARALRIRSLELAPDSHELRFWAAIAAANAGDLDTAVADARAAIALRPAWAEILPRMPRSVAPGVQALIEALSQR